MGNIIEMPLSELMNGYSYNKQSNNYICSICNKEFHEDEIFKVNDRYYNASKMIQIHMENEHGSNLNTLLSYEKKYTGITERQRELIQMVSEGLSDKDIATKTGVAASTVRHQRFIFREKAKQAKLFMAIYELMLQKKEKSSSTSVETDNFIPVHKGANMVDDRYFITEAEEKKILDNAFDSISPLKLKLFPVKEKKKIVILRKIAQEFKIDKKYNERQVNLIIESIYADFATIRRYLIEYGFMNRKRDCSEYWING